ncbi:hypothetical protein [Nocardia terpenica]|uniref:hypothetical protein n=1 Tax=Nocardia terpenica TaxID=455432 RepID=UPI00226BC554|nr:hypothetical protein [Nocardia terpenica]
MFGDVGDPGSPLIPARAISSSIWPWPTLIPRPRVVRHGPDWDDLLGMWRSTKLFLAHPKAIAAVGRECNKRGLYPDLVEVDGHRVPVWRGCRCSHAARSRSATPRPPRSLAIRTGEQDQGVIGLHQTGLPDEYEPSLNVRFKGIDDQSIISYLISCYYPAAVLVPDAIGILDNVLVARHAD